MISKSWFFGKRKMNTLNNEQQASLFSGMFQCEINNGYSLSPHDAVKILQEMSDLVKQLERKPGNLNKYDLGWIIRTVTQEPGGIMVHPDNVRYIYDMLKQDVPKWYVEKWGHTFKKVKVNEETTTVIPTAITV